VRVINTPIEAQYRVYYAIHLNHYSYPWGGTTYNKLLVTEYPNYDLSSVTFTQASTAKFLYPRLVGNPTYVDGVAEGHFFLWNSHAADTTTINSYTVTLIKTPNVSDNETTLGIDAETLTANNTIVAKGTLCLPIYMNIDHIKLSKNDKIILQIDYTDDGAGTVNIIHDNDSTLEDIKIKIPYKDT